MKITINQEATSIEDALGITEERMTELSTILGEIVWNTGDAIDILNQVNDMDLVPNEFAYIMQMMGVFASKL